MLPIPLNQGALEIVLLERLDEPRLEISTFHEDELADAHYCIREARKRILLIVLEMWSARMSGGR